MEHIIIRNVKAGEGEQLAAIESICFPAEEAASKEEVLKRVRVFPENFFVAELDGKVAGFINGCNTKSPILNDDLYHNTELHEPEGDYQTFFGLNVLPGYRRKGIAEQLVKRYIQAAKDRGRKGVILTCKEHMIHYYERFGFINYGVADSGHGGAVWYDMKLIFD